MSPEEVLKLAEYGAVEFVDLRFVGVRRGWHHFSVPRRELTLRALREGFHLPGAAVRSAREMDHPDLLLVPDADTARLDPFAQHPTLALVCDSKEPTTGADCAGAPRGIARKAEACLRDSGIAEQISLAPELTFFVFDQASFDQGVNVAHYRVDSREGAWRRGRDEHDNLATQTPIGEGAGHLPPTDSLHNLRAEMVAAIESCGVEVAAHRHGNASGGQAVLTSPAAELLRIGDMLATCRECVRNVAARHGKVATFMPKPLFGEPANSLHTRISLIKDGGCLLTGPKGVELSQPGRWAIGGLLKHADSLLALTCPTTNSYKRLVPGYGAPIMRAYATGDPRAMIHVPAGAPHIPPGINLRTPDPACNAYLAYSAVLLAMIDGIEGQIDPGTPLTGEPEPAEGLANTLEHALQALEDDHDYLLRGDVFTDDFISSWIAWKRDTEVQALHERPHPHEFSMYFNI